MACGGEEPGWYDAADLDPGDQLRTPTGDKVRVAAVRAYTATTRVHNLTINGTHTYHVGEGEGVLTHNAGGCHFHPAPKEIPGIPDLKRAKRKTSVQGGGSLRDRWKDKKGKIYEWDSMHAELEVYNKRGKHLGVVDHMTGEMKKGPVPGRRVEP
ncbi:colicin E3/pyocin S6 family cytotoxin [Saccharomonospora glauca]|uniref:Putative cytotoxic protein n=1 Tax=Saccharomonospora glauca K62 TaxID=928724 RepID=I1D6F4_9PSEU|nr:colicin E3/pyocin S6 family cytotoxin [Saccharomonospora glauca]EIF00529.1 putative cytotoxic protein [Saccharomonospora glauca K62]